MKINNSVVIHQPNFLPWLGYFAKLVYAERLVVLDNVMFSKRKHIDRVQIINSDGNLIWIGLPVGENYNTPCNKIYFKNRNSLNKIVNTLYSSYSKARFFDECISDIKHIILNCMDDTELLSEIDINISLDIMKYLKIEKPEIIRSSKFLESTFLEPTDRLIYLCEKTNSSKIIVGSIEATEIHDIRKLSKYKITFLLQDYLNNHPSYYQTRRTKLGFAKGLSILDCLFNLGVEETVKLLKLKPETYGKG